ncbi:MAG: T9SS type A sorting domain-containing protein [candidate division KSB1 bacterium]|nr:T9SS type A sorting domain-containing protein [candidate division KSB1 bacterium]MDZ7342123.1 T9SS type A sorting domain-containing protein [candidate division KSB1 bacterium]
MKNNLMTALIGSMFLAFAHFALSQEPLNRLAPHNLSLSSNGKFVPYRSDVNARAISPNGQFWCHYEIAAVSDEVRLLKNFILFEGGLPRFTLNEVPGSDVYISDAGFVAVMDMRFHFRSQVTIHFYSPSGNRLSSETFLRASLFGFSPSGKKFGVNSATGLTIISLLNQQQDHYPRCDQFDISADDSLVALASGGIARVYAHDNLLKEFQTDFIFSRKIKLTPEKHLLIAIDKKRLKAFSLSTGRLVFEQHLSHPRQSFRDLVVADGQIYAGIQERGRGITSGILRLIDYDGKILFQQEKSRQRFDTFNDASQLRKPTTDYGQLPWPFFPFDSMRTVWNHYEQHMGGYGSDYSYLHQGLDLITPIAEPTYAVDSGVVKCVLTIGGPVYWRMAISKVQQAEPATGWLYAHLIESSIQFDVGDTVQRHDYLGNIVAWTEEWGHIHFVEIQDSGLVWRYNDNEWGITYNPLLSLLNPPDTLAPVFEPVFPQSKFGFCINETSDYLLPDSLYGAIDIIAKVVDYAGDSPWQQPAYETFYWIKRLPTHELVFPRRLGSILNHAYPFYASDHYEPFAAVLYKRDSRLVPSTWMSLKRNYYHILTNNNGDSLINLAERDLAFDTRNFPDGKYRIFIEARDEYGNSTIDSMDVQFKNGLTSIKEGLDQKPAQFELQQNYPNPFNSATVIRYSIPQPGVAKLSVYDLTGREIIPLVQRFHLPGEYRIHLDANQFASGIYFYKLQLHHQSEVRKMLVIH